MDAFDALFIHIALLFTSVAFRFLKKKLLYTLSFLREIYPTYVTVIYKSKLFSPLDQLTDQYQSINLYSTKILSGPSSEAHKSLAKSCFIILVKAGSSTGYWAIEELGWEISGMLKLFGYHVWANILYLKVHALRPISENKTHLKIC